MTTFLNHLTRIIFRVKQEELYSAEKEIKVYVQQSNVLGPVFNLLYD